MKNLYPRRALEFIEKNQTEEEDSATLKKLLKSVESIDFINSIFENPKKYEGKKVEIENLGYGHASLLVSAAAFPGGHIPFDLSVKANLTFPSSFSKLPAPFKATAVYAENIEEVPENIEVDKINLASIPKKYSKEDENKIYIKQPNGSYENLQETKWRTKLNTIFENPDKYKGEHITVRTQALPRSFYRLEKIPFKLTILGYLTVPEDVTRLPAPFVLKEGDLDLHNSKILSIPDGIILDKNRYIHLQGIPTQYPPSLKSQLKVRGVPLEKAEIIMSLPEIVAAVGKKKIKGKGQVFKSIKELQDNTEWTGGRAHSNSEAILTVKKLSERLQKKLDIEWKDVYLFTALPESSSLYGGVEYRVMVTGEDKEHRPFALLKPLKESSYTAPYALSPTQKIRADRLYTKEEALRMLFPEEFPPEEKGPSDSSSFEGKKIRDLIARGGPVQWTIGTKLKRGDIRGVEGKYKALISTMSPVSQPPIRAVADILNITWDDMIVFRNRGDGDINFVVKGKDDKGREFYYDRGGTGQGGYSRVYSKDGKYQSKATAASLDVFKDYKG